MATRNTRIAHLVITSAIFAYSAAFSTDLPPFLFAEDVLSVAPTVNGFIVRKSGNRQDFWRYNASSTTLSSLTGRYYKDGDRWEDRASGVSYTKFGSSWIVFPAHGKRTVIQSGYTQFMVGTNRFRRMGNHAFRE